MDVRNGVAGWMEVYLTRRIPKAAQPPHFVFKLIELEHAKVIFGSTDC